LESCSHRLLDLAAHTKTSKVLAFCSISTGEFRFPKVPGHRRRAHGCRWLRESGHHLHRVVFNVFTQKTTMFTQPYSDSVEDAGRLLAQADFVLIGAGAGLSAAAGLNYQDPELFRKWYPQFARLGLNTIWEAIVAHGRPNDQNRRRFWAFWAHHILRIRYATPAAATYLDLRRLVSGKRHFVITTNVDGQFGKSGFPLQAIFTPQGDYAKLQCDQP